MKLVRLLLVGTVMLMANRAGAQNSPKSFPIDEATIGDVHAASRLGKFVERRPLRPACGHPLALVGADHAHPARLRVLDAARLADPHGSGGSLSGTKHRRRL